MGKKRPHPPFVGDIQQIAFVPPALLLAGALLLLAYIMPACVLAQAGGATEREDSSLPSYKEDPIDQSQRNKQSKISSYLRAGKFTSDQEQEEFDAYYKTYALARWTHTSSLSNLVDSRKELIINLRSAKSGAVHDHLNDLVLDYMTNVAKNDAYHPAVRYNAMLMIGDLNSVDGLQPTPLESAMHVLLAAVDDANQIDPLKIAALIGINRHIAAGVSNPQNRNQILASMLKLAAGNSSDASDPGRDWMRMQAIDILGLLGMPGNNNQAVQLLSGIIGDAKARFTLRCHAAEALGKIKITAGGGLKPADLARALGQLMLDTCDAELQSVKNAGAPVSRRRMKARFVAVSEGLKGPATLAKTPDQQAAFKTLEAILNDLNKSLDKDLSKIKDEEELKKTNEELLTAVEDCQTKLTDYLAKKP